MKVIIKEKLDNWNNIISYNRTNKYIGASKKKKEMNIIKKYLLDIPKITEYPITIKCIWHCKNINQDLDNKSLKSVLDTMQEVGILENDNIKHIKEINHIAVKDNIDMLEMEII